MHTPCAESKCCPWGWPYGLNGQSLWSLAGLVSGLVSGLVQSHPQGYSPCAMEKKGSCVAGGDEF